MENLTTKENVLTAYKNADANQKSLLTDLFPSVLTTSDVFSFEQACSINGVNPDDIIPFKTPKNGDERSVNAYAMKIQIIRAFNTLDNDGQPWKADWQNNDQAKYYPYYYMNKSSGSGLSYYDCDYVDSYSGVGSRLCFISEDVAEHFFEAFKPEFENFAIVK